jgi:hypothetical protein
MNRERFVKPNIDKYIQLYSRNAKLEEVNRTGVITDLILTEKGYWYALPPTIQFSGGGGSGATAEAIIDKEGNLDITSLKLTNEGSGYIDPPTITIIPQPTPNNEVYDIFIMDGGAGYTQGQTWTLTGGGGSGATGTINVSAGKITSVNITNAGSGYTLNPTFVVQVQGQGHGSGVVAVVAVAYGLFATARAKMALSGNRVYKYAWDLEENVEINENAILEVVDRQFIIQNRDRGESDVITEKPIVARIHEIGTKSIINAKPLANDNFSGGRIIDIARTDRYVPNNIKLEINSQVINRIVISLDYEISRRTGFIKDDEFLMILKIAEKEPDIIEFGTLNNLNFLQ